MASFQYFNRDISWLGFNERVLLEAKNPEVPLYERFRFLSIFSSNLDEFFRVRYPGLLALHLLPGTPDEQAAAAGLLKTIQEKVDSLQQAFGEILTGELLPGLRERGLQLYYGQALQSEHEKYVTDLFYSKVLSFLRPVILEEQGQEIALQNNALYFIVQLTSPEGKNRYGLLNIPAGNLPRFVSLPGNAGLRHILFLDDVIRFNIDKAFPGYTVQGCYCVKMTRNADINLADEWGELEEQIRQLILAREGGTPTRFLYEGEMPEAARLFVMQYFRLNEQELIEGSRYHNLKDFAELPDPGGKLPCYPSRPPLEHPELRNLVSIGDAVKNSDILLHLPYQSYNYILRFFNEAAIDPRVREISVTLYRVATDSHIANALISAARNGKSVTVFVELKARFDEINNLNWANKMKEAGVRIVYSIPEMKVHAKIALVKRKSGWKAEYLGLLSTGNFNENTARFYTDHLLITADKRITREMDLLFSYLLSREQPEEYGFMKFDHLLVSRFNLTQSLEQLIKREIAHKKAGKDARITIKINNLQESHLIDCLYEASNAGVEVRLMVRGICCLIPGVGGMSDHITVYRIVDRYLEHGRVFVFHNNGEPDLFMGSADLMDRNLHRRIEVLFPLYDKKLKAEMLQLMELQFRDNIQAVSLDRDGKMQPTLKGEKEGPVQSQLEIYERLGARL
ncbi:polyphosphate kinase [Anseongella ginsenosidimutans]|uniref:Polyphosphate kinase n=1 Tax=Anseongella ginsenosidimutans TaxID=496056 RepID=A0A4R3KN20_9SPHI|nr:polyphosphate kinase 1 [Anseongella ginsenosidimutans]QEC52431.1 polyphosphate kinase 1 [Anseongella ginsenosidimutans]TCS85819.1 polyphosphate kinase [Anseongella ginsenosidimutans]